MFSRRQLLGTRTSVGALNDVLHKASAFTRILGNDETFIPLDRTEAAFINSFTSEKRRVILTSRAVAEGDSIRVVEGPLVGREGWIRKINRRKGTALIETDAFGEFSRLKWEWLWRQQCSFCGSTSTGICKILQTSE